MKTLIKKNGSTLRITHTNILRALYRFQVLTTDLVVRAVGSVNSAATIRKKILELVEEKHIARFELATTGGRSPYVCVLAEKGMETLRNDYGYDMRFYKPPSHWKGMSSEYHMHPLELNKFIIAAHKINQFDKRIELKSFERDYEISPNPLVTLEPSGMKHGVIPDAVLQFNVQFSDGIKRRIIFVELERKTHSTKDFIDKIQGIYWVARNGIIEQRYNHPLPRVAVFSTISSEHTSWMKEQTQNILSDIQTGIKQDSTFNRMFHFATMPALQDGDIDVSNTFVAPSWTHPIGNDFYTLLGI